MPSKQQSMDVEKEGEKRYNVQTHVLPPHSNLLHILPPTLIARSSRKMRKAQVPKLQRADWGWPLV